MEEVLQQTDLWKERKFEEYNFPFELVYLPGTPLERELLKGRGGYKEVRLMEKEVPYEKPKRPSERVKEWMVATEMWNSEWDEEGNDFFAKE